MAGIQQSEMRNRLLRALPSDDFAILRPHLEPMDTGLRQVLIASDAPVTHLFFPESGFVSVVTQNVAETIEVGMIGREGLVGCIPILLGSDRLPYAHVIQAPGEVLRIARAALLAALDQSPTLRTVLLRFIQVMVIQAAQTAYANATQMIEARLARWLLMCRDRMDGNVLALTHELLSVMLGVQRTSVTVALQVLESNGSIRARRGRIEILDRNKLLVLADSSYGLPEAEYVRLIESP